MLKKSGHFSLLLGLLKYHDNNILFSDGMNAEACIFLISIKYTCNAYFVYTGQYALMFRFRFVQLSMDTIMLASQNVTPAVLAHHGYISGISIKRQLCKQLLNLPSRFNLRITSCDFINVAVSNQKVYLTSHTGMDGNGWKLRKKIGCRCSKGLVNEPFLFVQIFCLGEA